MVAYPRWDADTMIAILQTTAVFCRCALFIWLLIVISNLQTVDAGTFTYRLQDGRTDFFPLETNVVEKNNHQGERGEEKRSIATTPEDISKDYDFIRCLSKGECGLENKCSFSLTNSATTTTTTTTTTTNTKTTTPPSSPSSTYASAIITVKGHIMVVKNSMNYNITYYWDVLGTNNTYGVIFSRPRSITYFDTKFYGEHTLRLYVPAVSTPEGADFNTLNQQSSIPAEYLESIQTITTNSGDYNGHTSDCSRVQACRLLLNVCYGEAQERCGLYADVCDNFSDEDQIAKESCIPECIYQYYSQEFEGYLDLDSDSLIQSIKRGVGVRGSKVDGLCNTSPIVALSIIVFTLIVIALAGCYFAWVYRKSYKEVTSTQDLIGVPTTTTLNPHFFDREVDATTANPSFHW